MPDRRLDHAAVVEEQRAGAAQAVACWACGSASASLPALCSAQASASWESMFWRRPNSACAAATAAAGSPWSAANRATVEVVGHTAGREQPRAWSRPARTDRRPRRSGRATRGTRRTRRGTPGAVGRRRPPDRSHTAAGSSPVRGQHPSLTQQQRRIRRHRVEAGGELRRRLVKVPDGERQYPQVGPAERLSGAAVRRRRVPARAPSGHRRRRRAARRRRTRG